MGPDELDAIGRRAAAARPGPWVLGEFGAPQGRPYYVRREADPYVFIVDGISREDLDFIAHARTDVPALLARVRDLEAALANLIDFGNPPPDGTSRMLQVRMPDGTVLAVYDDDTRGWRRPGPVDDNDQPVPVDDRAARYAAARRWPQPTAPADLEALRQWIVHGDYSNTADPWHTLIEAYYRPKPAVQTYELRAAESPDPVRIVEVPEMWTWPELLEQCSRLHTSRLRDARPPSARTDPPESGDLREDSQMVEILMPSGALGVVVPTRMHEPGFYVRSPNGEKPHWMIRSVEELTDFRVAVELGKVGKVADAEPSTSR